MPRLRRTPLRCLLAASVAMVAASPARALSINFTQIAGDSLTADQLAGFQTAANAWESMIVTDVSVNISIGFANLGTGSGGGYILGGASPVSGTVDYGSFQSLLAAGRTTAVDNAAVASLPGSVYLGTISLTAADALALGYSYSGSSGQIQFTNNSAINWQYSRSGSGTVASNALDFVGVAEHEIGHILGFISDVGVSTLLAPLDLFRYSSTGTLSYQTGQAAYFSLDDGATNLGNFSTGTPYQASHWANLSGNLMQPALPTGAVQNITGLDLAAMDAIGWTLSSDGQSMALAAADLSEPLPEPATLLLLAGALMPLPWLRRRRR